VSLVEIIEGIGTTIDGIGVAVIAGGAILAAFLTIGRIRRADGGAYEFFRDGLAARFSSASNSLSPQTSSAPSLSHRAARASPSRAASC
jgi:hypothetical protein